MVAYKYCMFFSLSRLLELICFCFCSCDYKFLLVPPLSTTNQMIMCSVSNYLANMMSHTLSSTTMVLMYPNTSITIY